jgi:hypothetical protein
VVEPFHNIPLSFKGGPLVAPLHRCCLMQRQLSALQYSMACLSGLVDSGGGGGGGHGTGTNPEQMTPLAPAPQGKFFRFFGFYRGKAPHWQSCDPPVSPYSGLYSISLYA